MAILTVSEARAKLYRLIDETHDNHEPVTITGKRHSAVLISYEDWEAICETLHLSDIPGLAKSIRTGLKTPLSDCDKDIEW